MGDSLELRCRNYDRWIPGTSQKSKCQGRATCRVVSHAGSDSLVEFENFEITFPHDVGACEDSSEIDVINERAGQQLRRLIGKKKYINTILQ